MHQRPPWIVTHLLTAADARAHPKVRSLGSMNPVNVPEEELAARVYLKTG
jgi:hypothetical protein